MMVLNNTQNHGFTITDKYVNFRIIHELICFSSTRLRTIRTGFALNDAKNEILFSLAKNSPQLYWSLPPAFTGNKITSYGGDLVLSQRFVVDPAYGRPRPKPDVDVILSGNGITLYWRNSRQLIADELNVWVILVW